MSVDFVRVPALVRAFGDATPDKTQAIKPLEEASEVLQAWKDWREEVEFQEKDARRVDDEVLRDLTAELLGECADVIQAVCNLAAALGVDDLTAAMRKCEARNAARGRY